MLPPDLAAGATLGRLVGLALQEGGVSICSDDGSHWCTESEWTPGAYALIGAAAVLSGMTRMTLTLAAILVEVVDDMRMMPAIMLALCVAKIVGNAIAPESFDEMMIELQGLPFLEESPPPALGMLSAQNAIASPVVVLPEVVNVGFLVKLLDGCGHNGFPVVPVAEGDAGDSDAATVGRSKHRVVGLILRRQLLVMLERKVWEHNYTELPEATRHQFIASYTSKMTFKTTSAKNACDKMTVRELTGLQLADLDHLIDLRPFLDPSPLTVTTLMPLNHVYRLFNEIGVRHLPVLHAHGDHAGLLAGIITRKDLRRQEMEKRVMELFQLDLSTSGHHHRDDSRHGRSSTNRRSGSTPLGSPSPVRRDGGAGSSGSLAAAPAPAGATPVLDQVRMEGLSASRGRGESATVADERLMKALELRCGASPAAESLLVELVEGSPSQGRLPKTEASPDADPDKLQIL